MKTLARFALLTTVVLTLSEAFVSAREETKITPLDGAANSEFGAVAIAGQTAIVGAPTNSGAKFGNAYLFDTLSGKQLFQLTSSSAATGDNFGRSVGIHGDTAIVGAPGRHADGSSRGTAYLFDVSSGMPLAELRAPDVDSAIAFGGSVAIDGSTAIVGAIGNNSRTGAAYVFDVETGSELFKLAATDGDREDRFGSSVAISGNRAIIGARLDSDNGLFTGSAYVFDLTTGDQLFKLTAPEPTSLDVFGVAVAVDGNTIIIGANNSDSPEQGSGSAYLFNLTTGELLFELAAKDSQRFARFGSDVSISGDYAVVGAPAHNGIGVRSGAAYLFDVTTGESITKIFPSDAAQQDLFGQSVSLSKNHVIIGAPWDDDLGDNSGSAYIYPIPEPNSFFLFVVSMVICSGTRRLSR